MRCFGRYNASLWDDVFAELPVLTAQDVMIINFGAWYPRFNFNEPRVCLLLWEGCMAEHLENGEALVHWLESQTSRHAGGRCMVMPPC